MNEPSTFQILAVCLVFLLLCVLIARAARAWGRPADAQAIAAEQRRDAAVKALEWIAQAEHARAMADMYATRGKRLGESHAD